jgi:hypothetical protein
MVLTPELKALPEISMHKLPQWKDCNCVVLKQKNRRTRTGKRLWQKACL